MLVAAVILLAFLKPGSAGAAGGGGIVSHSLDTSGSGITPSEMRRAEPLELPTVSAGTAPRQAEAPESTGKPHYVEGTKPVGAAAGAATAAVGASARGFGKFTSNAVPDPTVFPNTANGKIFGKIKGVGQYTCSASVVHGKNESTLFTAGHCVKEPGEPYPSKLVFVPAYTEGNAPLGIWKAKTVFTQRAWLAGNINYDYAAVVVKPNGGQTLESIAGSKGFAADVPVKKKSLHAVGYPFNKNRTETMWECRGKFGGYDPGYRKPGPKPIGFGCDMKSGASGGGWTIPGDYLASVTSFSYDQLPNHLFGPHFTKAADKMRKRAGRE